eukprot:TRINITY_DN6426_c0_g1_i1.p1 TRINITY_DN6426_c0_g1~~TRINITY_DN6426_c0_g1_i1.p1  ORF type:complete len:1202 (+),score=377.45 TRINITY_DN6426_c0_g1_i1:319-3606(+)
MDDQNYFNLINQEGMEGEQAFYDKVIDKLVLAGEMDKALSLLDNIAIPINIGNAKPLASQDVDGVDSFLLLLIERTENKGNVWKYIIRMKNKEMAAAQILNLYTKWELPIAIDLLFMCKSHISQVQQPYLYDEIQKYHTRLVTFESIINVDPSGRWVKWQTLSDACQENPEAVIRSLLELKQHQLARMISELFMVPSMKNEIEESCLYHLLNYSDSAAGMEILSSLDINSAIPVVTNLLEKIDRFSTQLQLVQFLLHHPSPNMEQQSFAALHTKQTSLQILTRLPIELQQTFRKLVDHPSLIIESLIMSDHIEQLHMLFKEIPQLTNDDLLVKYARKAMGYQKRKNGSSVNFGKEISKEKSENIPARPNPEVDMFQLLREKGAEAIVSSVPQVSEVPARHSSGGLSNRSLARTKSAQAGPGRSRVWSLTGHTSYDNSLRDEHSFPPLSTTITKSLLELCSSHTLAADTCIYICEDLAQMLLNDNSSAKSDNLVLINVIQEILFFARSQYLKADLLEKDKPIDISPPASPVKVAPQRSGSGLSQMGIPMRGPQSLLTIYGVAGIQLCERLLIHVNLLQVLLVSRCLPQGFSLRDLSVPSKARLSRDKLITEDRMKQAIIVAIKCDIECEPAWAAWGLALLRMGLYNEAKEKLSNCLEEPLTHDDSPVAPGVSEKPDPTRRLLEQIVYVLETPPPPDSASLRSMHASLTLHLKNVQARSAVSEGLSMESYLSALHVSTAPASAEAFSSLDDVRLMQIVYYLTKYGTHRQLIQFWIKHGLLDDSCRYTFANKLPAKMFVEEVVMWSIFFNAVPELKAALLRVDPHLTLSDEYLNATCGFLSAKKEEKLLLDFLIFHKNLGKAIHVAIKLYQKENEVNAQLKYLDEALRLLQEHFPRCSEEKFMGPTETEKYLNCTQAQISVIRFLSALKHPIPPPSTSSMFGGKSQQIAIAEMVLTLGNFELCFQLIQTFQLEMLSIYTKTITNFCLRKQPNKVNDLLRSIKSTLLTDEDWDSAVMAAISVFSEMQEYKTAEKLVSRLTTSDNKIDALITCHKLKTAYLEAAKFGNMKAIDRIREEAHRQDERGVADLCQKALERNGY